MVLLHHNLLLLQLLAHHFGSPFQVLATSLPPTASSSAQQHSSRALAGDSLNSDIALARDGEAAVNLTTTTTDTSPNPHHKSNLIPRKNLFLEAATQYYSRHYIERAAVVAGFFMGVKQLGFSWSSLITECVAAEQDEKRKYKAGSTVKCVLRVVSQSLAIAATITGGISAYRDVQRLLEAYRQLKAQQNGGAPVDIPLHPLKKVGRDDDGAPGNNGGGLEIRHVGFWNDTVSSIVDAALKKRASSTNIDSGIELKVERYLEPEKELTTIDALKGLQDTIFSQLLCLFDAEHGAPWMSHHRKEQSIQHQRLVYRLVRSRTGQAAHGGQLCAVRKGDGRAERAGRYGSCEKVVACGWSLYS
ncbi:hypothetical protein V8F33_011349 [Rhypophila sp. PSN 637]